MARDLYQSLDLNLLKTFQVLMQLKNMRKASEVLHVSQPAISQSLQKLRHHFSDELFVKVKSGLEPTAFAESLSLSIEPHLNGLANAVNRNQEFDPSEVDQRLRIALIPTVQTFLAGKLYRELKRISPKAELEILPWTRATQEEIQSGRVLLGISIDKPASKSVYSETLLPFYGRLFVRQGHPLTKSRVKPEELKGVEFAAFITPGWNENHSIAQQRLMEFGVETKVGFRSEILDAVIDVVSQSDLILPHSNFFPVEQYPELRTIDVEMPQERKTLYTYSYCHIRNRHDLVTRWLIDLIKTLMQQQSDK